MIVPGTVIADLQPIHTTFQTHGCSFRGFHGTAAGTIVTECRSIAVHCLCCCCCGLLCVLVSLLGPQQKRWYKLVCVVDLCFCLSRKRYAAFIAWRLVSLFPFSSNSKKECWKKGTDMPAVHKCAATFVPKGDSIALGRPNDDFFTIKHNGTFHFFLPVNFPSFSLTVRELRDPISTIAP